MAWRIAQSATGHKGGMVLQHAYHGITDAVAALTPGAGQPRDPRVVTLAVPPASLSAHDTMGPGELAAAAQDTDHAMHTLAARGFAPAAFFIDSALTSSGIFDPPPAWAAAVAARVRAAGGLIVADEVQYGLGRSGSHLWGFARRGLRAGHRDARKAGGQWLSDGRRHRQPRADRGIPSEVWLLLHVRRQCGGGRGGARGAGGARSRTAHGECAQHRRLFAPAIGAARRASTNASARCAVRACCSDSRSSERGRIRRVSAPN